MSQSLVNEGGGARTPLSGAFAAGIILVVVLYFSHLLAALPQPVLAAVVLVAVTGLFKVSTLRHLRHTNLTEYIVAVAALAGVLSSGLLRGVMIGAVISLVLLIRSASRPHVALLGRIAGTRRFSDRGRHPDNELIPGVVVFRPESSLVYFNMDHVRDTIIIGSAPKRRRPGWLCWTFPPRRIWTCTARTCSRNLRTNSKWRACACR